MSAAAQTSSMFDFTEDELQFGEVLFLLLTPARRLRDIPSL